MSSFTPSHTVPPKRAVESVNSWTGKVHRYDRTPSPSLAELRLQSSIQHADEYEVLYRTPPTEMSHPPLAPTDPHATWMGDSALQFGVVNDALPSDIDLTSPRTGRVITCQDPNRHTDQGTFALYPACPKNPLCPPYPGMPPKEVQDPSNPLSCFTDGGLGKWDPRRVPLPYEPLRPWLGFHAAPMSLRQWHLGENAIPWARNGQDRYPVYQKELLQSVEYAPATAFFWWNQPGEPDKGGVWNLHLIDLLFEKRRQVEELALANLRWFAEHQPTFTITHYNLPWGTEISWQETRTWVTWAQGRDTIGRMGRQVAEIGALASWLWEYRDQMRTRRSEPDLTASYDEYMGCWAPTIQERTDWEFLQQTRVPVYMALIVPSHHPLEIQAHDGTFDANERYRDNPYDAAHRSPNQWWTAPHGKYTFATNEHLTPVSLSNHLPQSFKPPTTPAEIAKDTARPTSWYKPWTSYLFLDQQVAMTYQHRIAFRGATCRTFWRESQLLAPFVPSGTYVLNNENFPHPFFARSSRTPQHRGVMRYIEHYDSDRDLWWFEALEDCRGHEQRQQNARIANYTYIFNYPSQRVVIYSKHPFPGQNALFCYTSGELISISAQTRLPTPRTYHWKDETDAGQRYTWSPETEDSSPEQARNLVTSFGMDPESMRQMDIMGTDEVMDADVYEEYQAGMIDETAARNEYEAYEHEEPPSLNYGDTLARLRQQRVELEREVKRRLFRPVKGTSAISPVPHLWEVPRAWSAYNHPIEKAQVWPVRIANLHGDVRLESVVHLLVNTALIGAVDIILVGYYNEIDATRTVEVGLRHPEDACIAYCMLHGVVTDRRRLEVYLLKAMTGPMFLPDVTAYTPLSRIDRMGRIQYLQSCDELWPGREVDFTSMFDYLLGVTYSFEADDNDEIGSRPAIKHIVPSVLNSSATPMKPYSDDTTVSIPMHDPVYEVDSTYPASLKTVMHGSIRWDAAQFVAPLPKQNNKVRSKRQKTQEAPSQQKELNSLERKRIVRRHLAKSQRLIDLCKLALPPPPTFDFPPAAGTGSTRDDVKIAQERFAKMMTIWWDWLDACRDMIEDQRHEQIAAYDWSTVEDALGRFAGLGGIFGKEYDICISLLGARRPWASKTAS